MVGRKRILFGSLFCAAIALALACVAFWSAWNIWGISLERGEALLGFSLGRGGTHLIDIAQRLDLRLPDFMKEHWKTAQSRAISLGFYALVAVGIILALLSRKNVGVLPRSMGALAMPWRFSTIIRLIAFIVGAICMATVIMNVLNKQARIHDIPFWIVSIVCFGVMLADRRSGRAKPFLSRSEWIGLGIITGAFAVFYMWHATWWLYSSIGDEYGFYDTAMAIASGKHYKADPFSPAGLIVERMQIMIAVSQAAMMKILGENNFGWRASSAVFAILCFIPFYYFMRYYFSRTAAVIGTGVMACSHYLTTCARIGKPINNANIFLCLAFGFYAYFRQFPSRTRAYFYGSIIGLAFYFYTPAMFSLLLVLIIYTADIFRERDLRRWEYPVSFLIGMLVVAAPLICHPRLFGWTALSDSIFLRAIESGYIKPLHGSLAAGIARYIGRNTFLSLIAPFYYSRSEHFIYKSYLDPISAALFALGLCWSIIWAFRRRQAAVLIITFIMLLVLVGGFSKYPHAVATRSLLLFPWWAAFAGIGGWRLLELGYSFSSRRRLWWGFCWALIVVIFALNFYQLYEVVPNNYSYTYKMIVLKEAQSTPPDSHIYYITGHERGMVKRLQIYGFGSRFHQLFNKDFFGGDPWTMMIRPARIIVDGRNSERERVLKEIRERFPGTAEEKISEPRGRRFMEVFRLDKESEG